MRAEAQPPHRKWPGIVGAAAISTALIVAVLLFGHSPIGPSKSADPSPAQSTPPTSETANPTGCLGGATRDAKMVLSARARAPHTTNGAIESATAFVRWLNQYPYPTVGDIAAVQASALSSRAQTKDIAAFFATEPNLSGGLVPNDSPYNLSTVPGVYYLESASPNQVTTSIGTALVVDGALSPTLKGSITVTVSWETSGWKFVSSEGKRTTQDLYSIGRPFSSGC